MMKICIKELLYEMKLPELKQLLKQHNIKGATHLSKPALVSLLITKRILRNETELAVPVDAADNATEVAADNATEVAADNATEIAAALSSAAQLAKKEFKPKKHPRRVEILDRETGEIKTYKSLYSAAKTLGQCARIMVFYNGKVYRKRYEIKVLDPAYKHSLVEIQTLF